MLLYSGVSLTTTEVLMTRRTVTVLFLLLSASILQAQPERVDSAAVALIKEEGLQHSQVMNLLSSLCDVYSPRLTWSPEYVRGAEWVKKTYATWGITNVAYDRWAPLGRGWTLKNFSAVVTAPVAFPVIAYPSAWSPGFKEKEAEVVYLNATDTTDLLKYKGKLKGKFVLLSDLADVRPHFTPQATRLADSVLLRMANADVQGSRRGARRFPRLDRLTPQAIDSALAAIIAMNPEADTAAMRERFTGMRMTPRKLMFAQEEGAVAAITPGGGDGGTMLVQSASYPQSQDVPRDQRIPAYDGKATSFIPQIVFASEHYNRILRMIKLGEKVTLAMALQVETTKADSSFNVIAEIPGTDLKDEIVMIGGHFDTWHAGTGATDNNSGVAACMEAARILKVLADKHGLKTRRTIRIGFWGGEEQGLFGSREYVADVFAKREGDQGFGGPGGPGGPPEITKKAEYDKFYAYFNHDNGTGRLRGIYLQGNEAARPIFRRWLTAYGDPSAQTITIQNTGGTDHQSFDGVGLPGFQFIQDQIEYDSRTHHYNMDVYERLIPDDMKQAASVIAFFTWQAATRDGKFPRK
jgi:carboxypeptidase Q